MQMALSEEEEEKGKRECFTLCVSLERGGGAHKAKRACRREGDKKKGLQPCTAIEHPQKRGERGKEKKQFQLSLSIKKRLSSPLDGEETRGNP